MKTVYNPGGTDSEEAPRAIRYQFGGIFGTLPVGHSVVSDDLAEHLRRKYARLGVDIVPSEEEIAEDKKRSDRKIASRNARVDRPKPAATIPIPSHQVIPIEPPPAPLIETHSVVNLEEPIFPAVAETEPSMVQADNPPDGPKE